MKSNMTEHNCQMATTRVMNIIPLSWQKFQLSCLKYKVVFIRDPHHSNILVTKDLNPGYIGLCLVIFLDKKYQNSYELNSRKMM